LQPLITDILDVANITSGAMPWDLPIALGPSGIVRA
jgi:hypothetical protein